jgi:acetyl esterase/lipase
VSEHAGAAVRKHTYTYKVVGECRLCADVYGPCDGPPRPVILWMHGGALIAGHREDIAPGEAAVFVEAGYAVVSIDYRLAPRSKLNAIMEDVQDAFDWVRTSGPELFGADPGRVGGMGPSAGGYLALMTGFRLKPRPRALVSVAGYGDVAGAWYSRPDPFYRRQPLVSEEAARSAVGDREAIGSPGWKDGRGLFYLYCRQQGLWPLEVTGHDPDREPAAFDAFCPVRNLTADYPPTVLVHGDQDTDVPYEQSAMMAEGLAAAGVQREFITIAGGGHCSLGLNEAAAAETYARILAFLGRYLKRARL